MKPYGLLGQRLLHSLSPEIHRELGNFRFELFQLEPCELDGFFEKKAFSGINITYPYKNIVTKYCDVLSETAKETGSVDTICVADDGRLFGDNCECRAFRYMVQKSGVEIKNKKVLVFGGGENELTVLSVVRDMGAREIVVVSENGETNYINFYDHSDAEVIINTTIIGMYPNNGEELVDLKKFHHLSGVLDLVYNPRRTKLICDAEDLGVFNSDGLSLFVAFAYLTEISFGRITENDELMKKTYKTMSDRRKNIIFVGLPGCGKTTIAKVIAAKLGRPCIDVDRLIEMKAGLPVSDIFTSYGEKYYRELETEVLRKVTRNGGQVISTDSGAVLSKENLYYIRQNGYVVWLTRDLDDLKLNGIYLSRNRSALERIDAERTPVYRFLADICVTVTDNAETTVFEIIEKMNIQQNPGIY